jgi:hypothetical protein
MQKPILALILAVSVPWLLPAQQRTGPAEDPGGWNKAKWGMTRDQLVQAFGDQVKEFETLNGKAFGIPSWSISDRAYSVSLVFDKLDRVDEVKISPLGTARRKAVGSKPDFFVVPLQKAAASRTELFTLLRDKYGEPITNSMEHVGGGGIRCWFRWFLPRTEIFLSTLEGPVGADVGIVTLTYRQRRVSNDI